MLQAQDHRSISCRIEVGGSVVADESRRGPVQLFVMTESALASQVDAVDNRGARLEHDAVGSARSRSSKARFLARDVMISSLARGHVGVVVFIQDATTAEVLQAVDTGACKST